MIAGTIRDLLSQAGINVNGDRPWDIQVNNDKWYKRVWSEKSLGFGESYMDGWWDCQRVDKMICRLLKSDLAGQVKGSIRYQLKFISGVLFNLQSRMRSRIVARHHYDLGNDLYFSFLDPYLQYSCAYFKDTGDLNEAQHKKLDLIARKLELKSGDKLLDIGSGWGGLARYMAESRGCEVTGVNISKEQLKHSREFCRGLPVIFPNGMLPSISQISRSCEGLFDIQHLENLGPHYDKTLMAWHSNFKKAWPDLYKKNKKYDQRFKRMWEFYLLSCAGSFRAGSNQLWQIIMTRHLPGSRSV